jgi:hypothetical protein
MMKSNFREWTLDKIDDTFGTKQVFQHPVLDRLMQFEHQISAFEREFLLIMKQEYQLGGDEWNEVELENKFISPLIVLAQISNERFAYFLERELTATIGEYELYGRVDGMIATGFRSPRKPYFCLNEYKRESDPSGDPKGQALIEMIAAQSLNDKGIPIYGLYVVGSKWRFIILDGKNYAFSESLVADSDDIFDIFRVLKGLRYEIDQLVELEKVA